MFKILLVQLSDTIPDNNEACAVAQGHECTEKGVGFEILMDAT